MNIGFAMEYIPRRMCELGHGKNYMIRMRHILLQPNEQRTISGQNNLFVMVDPYCDLRVESNAGLFDMSEGQANELQYEHRGDITITNHSIFTNHVRFIQAIPNPCKTPCQ